MRRSSPELTQRWLAGSYAAAMLVLAGALGSGCSYDFDTPFADTGDSPPPGEDASVPGEDATADAAQADTPASVDGSDAFGDSTSEADAGEPDAAPPVSPLLRVVSGSLVLAGNASQTAVLPDVVLSRSMLVFGTSYDNGEPATASVSGTVESPAAAVFKTASPPATPVAVRWYVAEFASGVTVQRGTASITTAAAVDVPLPIAADPAKSFPLLSMRAVGTAYGGNDFVAAKLVSAQTLRLEVSATSSNSTVEWQVVTFDGCTVQSGETTLADGAASASATVSPVDAGRSWLVFTHTVSPALVTPEGPTRDITLRGSISGPASITFRRAGHLGESAIAWNLVSFTNGTPVLSGTAEMASDQLTVLAPLGAWDPARGIATAGGLYHHGGAAGFALADTGEASLTLDVTAAGGLLLTRGSGAAPVSVDWQAVQFR